MAQFSEQELSVIEELKQRGIPMENLPPEVQKCIIKTEIERAYHEISAQKNAYELETSIREIQKEKFNIVKQEEDDNGKKTYSLANDKGEEYSLSVEYNNVAEKNSSKRSGAANKKELLKSRMKAPFMKTMTVQMTKVGGTEKDNFVLRASVRSDVEKKSPLSLLKLFSDNLKVTIKDLKKVQKNEKCLAAAMLQAMWNTVLPDLSQTKKLTLIPADENSKYYQEHIAGRHGKDAITIGSKLCKDVPDDYILNLLKQTDKAYQKGIDKHGKLGRVVYAVRADMAIGTNAVYPLENVDQRTVFSTIREAGTDRAAKIKVALISEKDMPTTQVAQVIMGPYGNSGNAGVYTVIFGDEGMPFAESAVKRNPKDKEYIDKCQKYWDSHVILITPKELMANISELKAQGLPTKTQELALKSFQQHRGRTSPIIKPFYPRVSPNAVKILMPQVKSSATKQYT